MHAILLKNYSDPVLNGPEQDRFWVMTTNTNYDFWTTDPANLKSLASVGLDMSQNVPGSLVLQFYSKRNETLPRTLHMEVCSYTRHLCQVRDPTQQINELAGCQHCQKYVAIP